MKELNMHTIETPYDGPPLADHLVNYYQEAERVFGLKRDAAERLIGTTGIRTFRLGRGRYVRKSEFARIVAEAEAAEAAKLAAA